MMIQQLRFLPQFIAPEVVSFERAGEVSRVDSQRLNLTATLLDDRDGFTETAQPVTLRCIRIQADFVAKFVVDGKLRRIAVIVNRVTHFRNTGSEKSAGIIVPGRVSDNQSVPDSRFQLLGYIVCKFAEGGVLALVLVHIGMTEIIVGGCHAETGIL